MENKEIWKIKNNDGSYWEITFNSKEEAELFYSQVYNQHKGKLTKQPQTLTKNE